MKCGMTLEQADKSLLGDTRHNHVIFNGAVRDSSEDKGSGLWQYVTKITLIFVHTAHL
jgi:hypothetical protein